MVVLHLPPPPWAWCLTRPGGGWMGAWRGLVTALLPVLALVPGGGWRPPRVDGGRMVGWHGLLTLQLLMVVWARCLPRLGGARMVGWPGHPPRSIWVGYSGGGHRGEGGRGRGRVWGEREEGGLVGMRGEGEGGKKGVWWA